MLFSTGAFILLRYLRQIHVATMTSFFSIWGTLQSLIMAISTDNFELPAGLNHWLMGAGICLFTFLGQLFITLAFKFEQAGTVSLCRTMDVVFAFVWQLLFLAVLPDLYRYAT